MNDTLIVLATIERIAIIIMPIITALIGGLFAFETKRRKQTEAEQEAKSKQRAEESFHSMSLMSASVELGIATANAVVTGSTNGTMKKALDAAEKTNSNYRNFIRTAYSAGKEQ